MNTNTPCVTLRPFTREEYHDFFLRYEPDPIMDARPYRYQFTHVDRCYDYDQSRRDWYPTFGIFADDMAVGTLSLKRIDREKRRCEIGIMMVNDSCKGRGFGTAAMRQAIEMAVHDYGVRRIDADTAESNLRMQHILEKLGFRLMERLFHAIDRGGWREDQLLYSLEVVQQDDQASINTPKHDEGAAAQA